MSGITLRVIDGADRGRIFDELDPPITIGREEGNTIQLNDERVSRFHLKIQEDNERLVLTDLESTNGTKVNNEDIQLRILRFGDIISVGRSVILYGSRDQIAGRLSKLRGESEGTINPEESKGPNRKASPFDFDLNWNADSDLQATLYAFEPPEIPDRLTPGQAAQLAEVLDYLHIRIRNLLNSAQVEPKADRVVIDSRQWQSLLDLQSRLAEYLRCVSDPNASNG
jgi:pSer/pThr/pTyr-binding forkhead associated (FHA) protein